MTKRTRNTPADKAASRAPRRDSVTDDLGDPGANIAGLGSPPANIDRSHRPDLFDLAESRITPLDFGGADPGSAGGLGSGLGDTRGGAGSLRVGGAGIGGAFSPGSNVDQSGIATPDAELADETDLEMPAGGTPRPWDAGDRAITSTGSTDLEDEEADVASVQQSDIGSVRIADQTGPGAGLGGARGSHPGPISGNG
jgi:hypothetical protein